MHFFFFVMLYLVVAQITNVYLAVLEGFTLLNSILVSGRSTPSAPPSCVPPPSFFELAATLVVHPLYTTRAKSDEDLRAANEALRYLRDTIAVVGPVTANLATAFQFRSGRASRRKRKFDDYAGAAAGKIGSRSCTEDSDSDDDDEQLRTPFAGEKSVFRQRDGFWQVVGWAFNCSVNCKKRWERWRVWLEVMVEVLEEDYGARALAVRDEVASGVEASLAIDKVAREALVMQYLEGAGGRGGRRRVVSAILADGGEKAMREFGECWRNETKERKVKEQAGGLWEERKKINLDENEWGDYAINEDEDEVVLDGDQAIVDAVLVEDFGGIESIKLRLRLLNLVSVMVFAFFLATNANFVQKARRRGSGITAILHIHGRTLRRLHRNDPPTPITRLPRLPLHSDTTSRSPDRPPSKPYTTPPRSSSKTPTDLRGNPGRPNQVLPPTRRERN
jgi:hypothetical protein